ncbi:uncharacterized protein LOC112845464 [Oreochromis niloticus]|uniref:uncharacterized protein LOC112845464 n=1 Tax=Oreochromis niloticus TaxID=8128 RepID=UPI000DF14479|nr:uncharacterized protein LOC112845464 [Oreochromis niloticus]
MKTLGFLCILLFLCREVFGKLIQAPLGDGVEFLLSEECLKGRGRLNLRRNDASTQLIASLENVWKPGPQHPHRVNQSGLSLILENADLNDEGLYEFTCNGKDLEAIKLEVFVPSEVAVSEGEDATLPCRSVTAGQSVKSARWRRNGKVVLQLDAKTGGITYGEDVDTSRVSIPSEWDRQADLSLTIKRVQQQDEGVYYCDIDKAEKHRSAVRLRVHPQVPTAAGSTPLPTTTPTPSESSDRTWITVITVLVTAAVTSGIVGPLTFLLGRKQRRETRDEETGAQLNECHTTNNDQSSGDQHVSTNGFKRPPGAPEEITLLGHKNRARRKEKASGSVAVLNLTKEEVPQIVFHEPLHMWNLF